MKIFKKTLAILLCLIMAVGIVPLSASADTEPADYVKTDFRFEAGQPVPTKRSQYTVNTSYIASEEVEIILSAYTTGLDYMRDGVRLNNDGKFTEQNSGTFLKNTGYELKVSFTCRSKIETDLVLIAGGETYSPYLYQFREDRIWIDGHKENVWDICYFYYIPIADMAQTVTTYAQLQSALSQYGTNAIKLGNDITKEIGLGKTEDSEAAQLTVNGNKILNLNGKKLKVVDHSDVSSDKDYTLDSIRTLFTVSAGADFTVEDTDGAGEVKYDAHYISPTAARFDYARYSDVAQRNMFDVHGKLTVNGGTFIAGGAKKQYLSDQLKHAYQIAAGYIVNTNEDGEATFNGGKFIGHTYFGDYIVFRGFNPITINGGEFENNGAGYFVSKYMIKDNLIINNGSFDAKTFTIRTKEHSAINSRYEEGTIKEFRIPAGSWDNEAAIVIKGGKRCSDLAADYLVNYKEDDRIDIITPSLNAWQRKGKPIVFDSLAASCTYVIGADNNDIVSFKLNKLSEYLTDMGYSWDLAEVLYDTTGKKVYEYHNNGSDYDDGTFGFKDDCKTPGTYTYYIIVSLKNPDGNYCGFKKYTLLVKAIEPCKTHDYYVSRTTATCTSGGTITETCTKCGETKTTNVGALGHTYEEYEGEYQWSYDSTNHWKYCWRCDKNFSQGKHTFNSNRICTACGLDNNCDYGNAMDMEVNETHHWWACETHAPEDACPNDHKLEYGAHTVCPVDGMGNTSANTTYNCAYGYRCDGCGHYFGETGNHTWVMWRRIPATCYSEGRNIYKCTNDGKIDPSGNKVSCGYKTVTIPKTEHKWTLVSDTATCQADGKATYKCTTSGCGETKTVDSQKTGHIYSLVSDTATCTSSGEATYKCNTCSASYKEVSPAKGHNYIEDSYVAPTTEAEGKITYKCTDCGNVKTETLEKLSVIREPKTKSVNCKDGVLIRPNFAVIPEGATVEWTASNGCFNVSVDAEGNLKAISNSSGDTTFTAKVKLEDGTYMTDMYGNEVVSTTTVKSNAGFFQKLIGFFKGLFGLTKIHE